MFDPALERDREELSFDSLGSPDDLEAVAIAKLSAEHRRYGSDAVARSCELAQQRVILELADGDRPQIAAIEPLIQGAPDRGIVGRQENPGAVQGLWVAPHQLLRERPRHHPEHVAPTERMIVGTNV